MIIFYCQKVKKKNSFSRAYFFRQNSNSSSMSRDRYQEVQNEPALCCKKKERNDKRISRRKATKRLKTKNSYKPR